MTVRDAWVGRWAAFLTATSFVGAAFTAILRTDAPVLCLLGVFFMAEILGRRWMRSKRPATGQQRGQRHHKSQGAAPARQAAGRPARVNRLVQSDHEVMAAAAAFGGSPGPGAPRSAQPKARHPTAPDFTSQRAAEQGKAIAALATEIPFGAARLGPLRSPI